MRCGRVEAQDGMTAAHVPHAKGSGKLLSQRTRSGHRAVYAVAEAFIIPVGLVPVIQVALVLLAAVGGKFGIDFKVAHYQTLNRLWTTNHRVTAVTDSRLRPMDTGFTTEYRSPRRILIETPSICGLLHVCSVSGSRMQREEKAPFESV